jgi:hypothetical protein
MKCVMMEQAMDVLLIVQDPFRIGLALGEIPSHPLLAPVLQGSSRTGQLVLQLVEMGLKVQMRAVMMEEMEDVFQTVRELTLTLCAQEVLSPLPRSVSAVQDSS